MYSAHAYYYEPVAAQSDGGEVTILLLLLIIGFIVAIYWLATWKPEPEKKKDEKSLPEEIDSIFSDLRNNALMLKREEVIPTLDKAQGKVTEVLAKRKLYK
ncbi:MAG: hypothetical protein HC850_00890 [Rhodomicrobium sp.]|nr:hypothetical protein [Rhodomicrobium sp.]